MDTLIPRTTWIALMVCCLGVALCDNQNYSSMSSLSNFDWNGPLRIISKEEWLGKPALHPLTPLRLPVENVIIGHTASVNCTTLTLCIKAVQSIQRYQIESRGFDDIGYNFLIGADGFVYAGRGWNFQGAHTKGFNNGSICISFIGNFDNYAPAESQLYLAQKLIEEGVNQGKVAIDYALVGQNQLTAIQSPGKFVIDIIKTWPHWTADLVNRSELKIVSRNEWLAQPPVKELAPLELPASRVIIAHTATENCTTKAECAFHVRLIQTFHIESRGWDDIGYNFLVGGDGALYVGRGWDSQGTHTKGYNAESICIAFIGTFNKVVPPKRQLDAARKMIEQGVKLGKLSPNYSLYGHRQLTPSESPGLALYEIIKHWNHWTDIV